MRFNILFKNAHMAVGIERLEMYQYLGAFVFNAYLEFFKNNSRNHLSTISNVMVLIFPSLPLQF